MFRFLFLLLVLEVTLASNVFVYRSRTHQFTVKYDKRFEASLLSDKLKVNLEISETGNVLRCTPVKLHRNGQILAGESRVGNIDELIKFFISRGVTVDNLALLTNFERLIATCYSNEHFMRVKRSTRRRQGTMFIYPGTKWCGKGNIARNEDDLGTNAEADSCCRSHDRCEESIVSGSRRHYFTNTSPFTVNTCACDERFKTCLQDAETMAADNIGELFFNRVGMQCYVLRPAVICTKKNFWSQCTRHARVLKAFPVKLPRWISITNDE